LPVHQIGRRRTRVKVLGFTSGATGKTESWYVSAPRVPEKSAACGARHREPNPFGCMSLYVLWLESYPVQTGLLSAAIFLDTEADAP
jgi:hypothetical protein